MTFTVADLAWFTTLAVALAQRESPIICVVK